MELFKIIAIFCIFSAQLKVGSSAPAPYIKCNADGYCKSLRIGPASSSIEGICSNPEGKALRRFRTYFWDIDMDCYFNEDGIQDYNYNLYRSVDADIDVVRKMEWTKHTLLLLSFEIKILLLIASIFLWSEIKRSNV